MTWRLGTIPTFVLPEYRCAWLAALLLLLCPLSADARAGARHVLVLSSSERPFAPQAGFADQLVPELIRGSREPIDFVEMSIFDARSQGITLDVSIARRLQAAFGTGKPDLVITVGGPAATFVQEFRERLFPTAPILIAGVDRRFVDNGTFTDNETTVAIQHDPALIIDAILRLLPDTRTITVIIGASPVEQFWLKVMKHEFQRFDGRVQFAWTNELSFAEIKERCRTLPAHSAIFFALLSLDGKGEPQIGDEAMKSLHAVANAPMFGLYTSDLGTGIVGGPLLTSGALSRTTAKVALRMLDGESPASIKTPIERAGQSSFDWRELSRWKIEESRLPAGSAVLFRPPTMWQRYKRPLGVGTLVIGLPVAAIALLIGIVKQRRARNGGPAASAVPPPVPANGTVMLWTAGPDGTRVESSMPAGATPDAAWWTSLHPDDVARSVHLYQSAFARREPFQMEYRVRDDQDTERWILDTGLPRFSGEDFSGYVGSVVDVTGLGRARAELSNLSRHLMEAHDRESAAIAKKLHEDVCQRIMALTLRLRSVKGAPHDAERQGVVDEIGEQLASLVGELVSVPDPVYQRLDLLGLTTAARRFCEQLSADSAVAIHFHDENVPGNLPTDVALALFRVLQDAVVNAVMHSTARDVRVWLRGSADEIRLEVVDSGVGFDPQHAIPTDGVGLVAIRERVKRVHGGSAVTSHPGEGTRVEAWIPLAARPI